MVESPKVQLSISLRLLKTPDEPDFSALQEVQLDLYRRLLSEEVAPKLVDITNTGVWYGMSVGSDGLSFGFVGFAAIMPKLITQVLSEFNNFNSNSTLTPKVRFDRQLHQYREALETYSQLPISYAIGDRDVLLTKGSKSRAEYLEVLDKNLATLENSVTSVSDHLLSRQLQLTTLAMGNLGQDEAQDMIGEVVASIQSPENVEMAQSSDAKVERITPIVNLKNPVEVRKANPRHGDKNDVAVVSIISGLTTVENRVLLALISQIFSQVAFNELRTNQQLGYIANGGLVTLSNVQMLSAIVQGDRRDADHGGIHPLRVLCRDAQAPQRVDRERV